MGHICVPAGSSPTPPPTHSSSEPHRKGRKEPGRSPCCSEHVQLPPVSAPAAGCPEAQQLTAGSSGAGQPWGHSPPRRAWNNDDRARTRHTVPLLSTAAQALSAQPRLISAPLEHFLEHGAAAKPWAGSGVPCKPTALAGHRRGQGRPRCGLADRSPESRPHLESPRWASAPSSQPAAHVPRL